MRADRTPDPQAAAFQRVHIRPVLGDGRGKPHRPPEPGKLEVSPGWQSQSLALPMSEQALFRVTMASWSKAEATAKMAPQPAFPEGSVSDPKPACRPKLQTGRKTGCLSLLALGVVPYQESSPITTVLWDAEMQDSHPPAPLGKHSQAVKGHRNQVPGHV